MGRALIVKLGAIGDVVMAIPAARALHDRGDKVTWIVGNTSAEVLRMYPWIDVIAVDERPILRGSTMERIRAVFAFWGMLPRGEFDLCATLYFDSRYRILTLPFRAKKKVMLSHDDRRCELLPGRHHTDEYARILLSAPDDVRPTQLAPVPPDLMPAPPVPKTQRSRIVIAPAGAKNFMRDDSLRRWPAESYAVVASTLLDRGYEVILAGGPDDGWVRPAFSGLAVDDQIGTLTLPESIALFDSADVVCTHDTGPLHLAGITTAAIVAIFGPVDPHGRLPQRANSVALWGGEGFACRPCYDGRTYAWCINNLCVQQITTSMVVTEIESLLAARGRREPQPPRIRVPRHTPVQISGMPSGVPR